MTGVMKTVDETGNHELCGYCQEAIKKMSYGKETAELQDRLRRIAEAAGPAWSY